MNILSEENTLFKMSHYSGIYNLFSLEYRKVKKKADSHKNHYRLSRSRLLQWSNGSGSKETACGKCGFIGYIPISPYTLPCKDTKLAFKSLQMCLRRTKIYQCTN